MSATANVVIIAAIITNRNRDYVLHAHDLPVKPTAIGGYAHVDA